jgi:hypothetical protein
LTSGNSEKLGVTVQNGEIFIKGERVPFTPEDVQLVIGTLRMSFGNWRRHSTQQRADLDKEQH